MHVVVYLAFIAALGCWTPAVMLVSFHQYRNHPILSTFVPERLEATLVSASRFVLDMLGAPMLTVSVLALIEISKFSNIQIAAFIGLLSVVPALLLYAKLRRIWVKEPEKYGIMLYAVAIMMMLMTTAMAIMYIDSQLWTLASEFHKGVLAILEMLSFVLALADLMILAVFQIILGTKFSDHEADELYHPGLY